jgi:hypothetical protein
LYVLSWRSYVWVTMPGVVLLAYSLIAGWLAGGAAPYAAFFLAFFWLAPCVIAGLIVVAALAIRRFANRFAKPSE